MSDSYWQRGFNDGFMKLIESPPNKNGPDDRENRGYSNGYEAGRSKRFAEDWPQRKARILALVADDGAIAAQPGREDK